MDEFMELVLPPTHFSGFSYPFKDAQFVIFGVPFDGTSTYRPGSRFAPDEIRQASYNIERFSLVAFRDLDEIKIHDPGNIDVIIGDITTTLQRVTKISKKIVENEKKIVMMGGEHSITYGSIKSIEDVRNTAIIQFDAHMDMRTEYYGDHFSHTTFMRRILESTSVEKIIQIGIRAICEEEYKTMRSRENKLHVFTMNDILKNGKLEIMRQIKSCLEGMDYIYITIDMDVLDPAYAPGVANPAPGGINYNQLIYLLKAVIDERAIGLDLVEVCPPYDNGITVISAAKILFEAITLMSRNSK